MRGQNLLGYKHYPDDAVKLFVKKSVENGIDVIRIFDALNDLRNIEVAVKTALACGAQVQGAICYTISPIHDLDSYVKTAEGLKAMGVQSICIKDMAGILSPKEAYETVEVAISRTRTGLVEDLDSVRPFRGLYLFPCL